MAASKTLLFRCVATGRQEACKRGRDFSPRSCDGRIVTGAGARGRVDGRKGRAPGELSRGGGVSKEPLSVVSVEACTSLGMLSRVSVPNQGSPPRGFEHEHRSAVRLEMGAPTARRHRHRVARLARHSSPTIRLNRGARSSPGRCHSKCFSPAVSCQCPVWRRGP
jgi:hypothetical protein